MFVKPRDGLKILRPDTRTVLLDCGEHVPDSSFWRRRLKDGDVIKADIAEKVVKVKKEKIVKEFKQEAEV